MSSSLCEPLLPSTHQRSRSACSLDFRARSVTELSADALECLSPGSGTTSPCAYSLLLLTSLSSVSPLSLPPLIPPSKMHTVCVCGRADITAHRNRPPAAPTPPCRADLLGSCQAPGLLFLKPFCVFCLSCAPVLRLSLGVLLRFSACLGACLARIMFCPYAQRAACSLKSVMPQQGMCACLCACAGVLLLELRLLPRGAIFRLSARSHGRSRP